MNDEQRLKLAIQKSGRLAERSLALLEQCGIDLLKSKDQLFCKSENFPLDVYFVRDDDIPTFVASGTCHIGIIGENVLCDEQLTLGDEKINAIEVIEKLGFGRCRLSIAAPHGFDYTDAKSLEGKRIATSYKGLLSQYLDARGIQCELISMQGAVEIAPRIDMADAICDLVSTGSTLAMNGLSEVETIFESQSVLVRSPSIDAGIETILERFLMRLKGVRAAQSSKYVMLHSPTDKLDGVKAVLPGSETPTILSLQGRDDLVAVHAVCNEGIFWNTMEDLKAAGASSILVLPIEKMLD